LTDVVQISVAYANGCALRGDATVWCWGVDADFLHPDGVSSSAMSPDLPPTQVPGLAGVVEIRLDKSLFRNYPCARLRDGSVTCVGAYYLGPVTGEAPKLHRIGGLAGVRSIALGDAHQCAVLADRSVSCWGDNSQGETGQPIAVPRAPIAVSGVTGVHGTLVAGHAQTCLLGGYTGAADGLYCWGAFRAAPARIDSKRLDGKPIEVALGDEACVRTDLGHVFCFDDNWLDTWPGFKPLKRERPQLADPIALAKSEGATCALERDGSVECWDHWYHSAPTAIASIAGARAIAIDIDGNGCGIMADATVACWAVYHDPDFTVTQFSEAEPAPSLHGALALALDSVHGCALMPGGDLKCWTGLTPDAKQRPAHTLLTKVKQVAASTAYSCALRETGEVLCWGANDSAQLGTGAPSGPHPVPVRVLGP
jgi:hypothetical protein